MTRQQANDLEAIVLRARKGDQVAIGLIAATAEQAKKGNRKCQASARWIAKYIQKNPAQQPEVLMMGEAPQPTAMARRSPQPWKLICMIANGGSLVETQSEALMGIDSSVEEPQAKAAFRQAVENWQKPMPRGVDPQAWSFGKVVGMARAIQRVRLGAPFAVLCPVLSWELD